MGYYILHPIFTENPSGIPDLLYRIFLSSHHLLFLNQRYKDIPRPRTPTKYHKRLKADFSFSCKTDIPLRPTRFLHHIL